MNCRTFFAQDTSNEGRSLTMFDRNLIILEDSIKWLTCIHSSQPYSWYILKHEGPPQKKNTWPLLSLATKSLPQKKGAMEAWTNNWTITLARHIGQEILWSYELMVRPMSNLKKSGNIWWTMWECGSLLKSSRFWFWSPTRWGNSWCHATGIWLQLMRRLRKNPKVAGKRPWKKSSETYELFL